MSKFGRPGNRSGWLGDFVSGPWGSIPGPGEGLLRGFWTLPRLGVCYTGHGRPKAWISSSRTPKAHRPMTPKAHPDHPLARPTIARIRPQSSRFDNPPGGFLKAVWPDVLGTFGRFWVGFGPVSGQSWARDRYQRFRLEKRCINQPKLARETDSKAILMVWAPEGSLAWCLGVPF